MAGDTANVTQWGHADVYIADNGTASPADTWSAWAAPWAAVGLLDGEAGFAEAREQDSSDFYAWGGILTRTVKSKHKRTVKFSALEDYMDNPQVHRLLNPGSAVPVTAGDVTSVKIKPPTSDRFAIGLELRDGDTTKRRTGIAEVQEVGEVVDSESGTTVYEITVVIYPDANGDLWDEKKGPSTDPA